MDTKETFDGKLFYDDFNQRIQSALADLEKGEK